MHFTGNVWRPPYEAASALLQVTAGCTHNRCRFCSLYDAPFALSPAEEVDADIEELARYASRARRVFLTGANPFGIANARLEPVLERIRERLPHVESIGGFVRIGDLRHKSDADLAQWARLGVDDLTIGVETGYDPALAFMDKGHTAADELAQCHRLDEAGIRYSFFYLAGIAGAGRGEEAARASAAVFSQLNPVRVGILSMMLFPDSRLAEDVRAGRFRMAGERELLREIRTLVAELTCKTLVSTAHVSDAVQVEGVLPRDRAPMLARLDRAIAELDEGTLSRYRRSVRSL